MLAPAKNLFFTCYKCTERLTKAKPLVRKSIDNTSTTTSTSELNDSSQQRELTGNDDNITLSSIAIKLNKLNDELARIHRDNMELKQLVMSNNCNENLNAVELKLSSLSTKFDQHLLHESEKDSVIMDKIDSMQQDIRPVAAYVKTFQIDNDSCTNVPSQATRSVVSNVNDPLNWSFSFNRPAATNDHSELYQLLHSFEQNTWSTFDYLRHKLIENTDTVHNVESICKELSLSHIAREIVSPAVDSVDLGTLQSIQEKCCSIEERLRELSPTLTTVPSVSDVNDDSVNCTQRMAERLRNIISTTAVVAPPVFAPAVDDLSTSNVCVSPHSDVHVDLLAATFKEKRWFYLTNLKPGTMESTVKSYICSKIKVNPRSVTVKSLLRKDHDPASITFVSFKVVIDDTIDTSTISLIWPDNVKITVFVPKNEYIRRHRQL